MIYIYKILKKYSTIVSLLGMILLASFSAQKMPSSKKNKSYKSSFIKTNNDKNVSESLSVENTTTTNTTIEEVSLIVPETTTTEPTIVKTTTTKPVIRTTTTESSVVTTTAYVIRSGAAGPPHNTTTLVGCISYYESTWGIDPNVFQFTLGTWHEYGGKGAPEDAPYWRQEEVFWKAWADDGEHHWAAQKGKCF